MGVGREKEKVQSKRREAGMGRKAATPRHCKITRPPQVLLPPSPGTQHFTSGEFLLHVSHSPRSSGMPGQLQAT